MKENDENNSLNEPGKSPFSLPEGYFDSFAQKMMLKFELTEEIKELKILSSIDKKLPFITPENYFDKNAASAEAKVELNPYQTLSGAKKDIGFVVPELYFEKSAGRLETRAGMVDELNAYPVLKAIDKQNVFSVPDDYFDNFSYDVRDRIITSGKANRFDNVLHMVFNRRTAYAIAALLVISLGIYYFSSQQKETDQPCNGLACLDKSEVLKGNHLINMDDESLMEIVNPDTLSKNLNRSLSGEEKTSDKKQKEDFVLENADVNDIVDEI